MITNVLVSEYYILYAFCTFLYFQNPHKYMEIRKFINDSYVPLINLITYVSCIKSDIFTLNNIYVIKFERNNSLVPNFIPHYTVKRLTCAFSQELQRRLDQTLGKPGSYLAGIDRAGNVKPMTIGARLYRVEQQVSSVVTLFPTPLRP